MIPRQRACGNSGMNRVWIYPLVGVVAIFTNSSRAEDSPTDRAWVTLQKALNEGQVHRQQAMAALGCIDAGNERAVKLLEDGLQDKDSLVRKAAAIALGNMKARQAIPYLREAVSDKGEVAFAAAKALSDMGDSGGRDMFVAVIAGDRSDAPGFLTGGIRDAKKRIKHPEGLLLIGASEGAGVFFPYAGYPMMAAQEAVKDKGAPSRAEAAMYLAKDPDPYAVTLLEWALTDKYHAVRAAAACGLAKRGTPDSIVKLEPLLDDDHDSVRTTAAAAIIHIADRQGGAN